MKKTKSALLCLMLTAAMAVAALAISACAAPSSASSEKESFSSVSEAVEEVKLEPFYALVVGNDSRYKTVEDDGTIKDGDPSYGDTIMLARVDPIDLKVSLLSIPRDTYYELNGQPEKINSSHLEGIENMVKAVEELTGADISYYFDEHFVDFGQMIDDVEGATVDVPVNIKCGDILKGGTVNLGAGEGQLLNGPESLAFVRMRKHYIDDGEACRQVNARQLVQKVITAVAGGTEADAAKYAAIIEKVSKTNMSDAMLKAVIEQFMGHADEIEFQLGTGPYVGAIDANGIWSVPREEGTYAALVDMMENGGDMTEVVALPYQAVKG